MKQISEVRRPNTRKKILRCSIAVLAAMAMLFALPGVADATPRVTRGFTGSSATHYRTNYVTTGQMSSSHIHFAVMASCSYGDVQLGTYADTLPNRTNHRGDVHTNQSGWGKLNAGAHSAIYNGRTYRSPGGQNGWDRCW